MECLLGEPGGVMGGVLEGERGGRGGVADRELWLARESLHPLLSSLRCLGCNVTLLGWSVFAFVSVLLRSSTHLLGAGDD